MGRELPLNETTIGDRSNVQWLLESRKRFPSPLLPQHQCKDHLPNEEREYFHQRVVVLVSDDHEARRHQVKANVVQIVLASPFVCMC